MWRLGCQLLSGDDILSTNEAVLAIRPSLVHIKLALGHGSIDFNICTHYASDLLQKHIILHWQCHKSNHLRIYCHIYIYTQ